MKNEIFLAIKKLANKAGYDIKYYHPYYDALLKEYKIKTVIDIGANDGQFAKSIHKKIPQAQIYSFEPLKESFNALKKNFLYAKNFIAFNFALGETSGKSEINRSGFSPSSSLLSMSSLHKKLYPKSADGVKEEIIVKRLDEVSNELALEKPILVKIDVQGFEDKVIAGGKETLKRADVVIVETSFVTLYEGQPLFADIHDLMKSLGFSYHGHTEQHWNNRTQNPIYEDSIFLNDKK